MYTSVTLISINNLISNYDYIFYIIKSRLTKLVSTLFIITPLLFKHALRSYFTNLTILFQNTMYEKLLTKSHVG